MKKIIVFSFLSLIFLSSCSDDAPKNLGQKKIITENLVVEETQTTSEILGCEKSLDDLFSTEELSLIEGPLECGDDDMLCGIFKVNIESPDTADYPVGNVELDEKAYPVEAILVVRSLSEETLCNNRWIVFDAGGYGNGYVSTFGNVLPAVIKEGGEGYGDDLILKYVNEGYITVDLLYQYPSFPKSLPDPYQLAEWIPTYNKGTAWFRNLNNASFLGSASRSRIVYEWAYQNSGDKKICAHAHSSGSGRLIGALTRLGSEDLFDTIVFDGGPVFAYMPWICVIDDGPLGPRPEEYFDLSIKKSMGVTPLSISCAHTEGTNENNCDYDNCFNSEMDDAMLEDSFFVSADDRDFPEIDISIVMGGDDSSNAFKNIMLWLGGYTMTDGTVIPPLTAKSITLKQGYCESSSGNYLNIFPCSNWDVSNFSSISNTDTYEDALIHSEHETTTSKEGMEIVQALMLETCEL